MFRRRQRWLDGAALAHEGDDLGEAAEVDLRLPRQHAAIGLEIKRKRRAGDFVGSAGQRDDGVNRVAAMTGIADEAERIGERADEADDCWSMGLRKIAPRGDHLELERGDGFGRQAEPSVTLLDRDQVIRLAERNGVALPAFQTRGAHRRADQFLHTVVGIAECLEREQLAHRDRNGIDRQRQPDELALEVGKVLELRLGDQAIDRVWRWCRQWRRRTSR